MDRHISHIEKYICSGKLVRGLVQQQQSTQSNSQQSQQQTQSQNVTAAGANTQSQAVTNEVGGNTNGSTSTVTVPASSSSTVVTTPPNEPASSSSQQPQQTQPQQLQVPQTQQVQQQPQQQYFQSPQQKEESKNRLKKILSKLERLRSEVLQSCEYEQVILQGLKRRGKLLVDECQELGRVVTEERNRGKVEFNFSENDISNFGVDSDSEEEEEGDKNIQKGKDGKEKNKRNDVLKSIYDDDFDFNDNMNTVTGLNSINEGRLNDDVIMGTATAVDSDISNNTAQVVSTQQQTNDSESAPTQEQEDEFNRRIARRLRRAQQNVPITKSSSAKVQNGYDPSDSASHLFTSQTQITSTNRLLADFLASQRLYDSAYQLELGQNNINLAGLTDLELYQEMHCIIDDLRRGDSASCIEWIEGVGDCEDLGLKVCGIGSGIEADNSNGGIRTTDLYIKLQVAKILDIAMGISCSISGAGKGGTVENNEGSLRESLNARGSSINAENSVSKSTAAVNVTQQNAENVNNTIGTNSNVNNATVPVTSALDAYQYARQLCQKQPSLAQDTRIREVLTLLPYLPQRTGEYEVQEQLQLQQVQAQQIQQPQQNLLSPQVNQIQTDTTDKLNSNPKKTLKRPNSPTLNNISDISTVGNDPLNLPSISASLNLPSPIVEGRRDNNIDNNDSIEKHDEDQVDQQDHDVPMSLTPPKESNLEADVNELDKDRNTVTGNEDQSLLKDNPESHGPGVENQNQIQTEVHANKESDIIKPNHNEYPKLYTLKQTTSPSTQQVRQLSSDIWEITARVPEKYAYLLKSNKPPTIQEIKTIRESRNYKNSKKAQGASASGSMGFNAFNSINNDPTTPLLSWFNDNNQQQGGSMQSMTNTVSGSGSSATSLNSIPGDSMKKRNIKKIQSQLDNTTPDLFHFQYNEEIVEEFIKLYRQVNGMVSLGESQQEQDRDNNNQQQQPFHQTLLQQRSTHQTLFEALFETGLTCLYNINSVDTKIPQNIVNQNAQQGSSNKPENSTVTLAKGTTTSSTNLNQSGHGKNSAGSSNIATSSQNAKGSSGTITASGKNKNQRKTSTNLLSSNYKDMNQNTIVTGSKMVTKNNTDNSQSSNSKLPQGQTTAAASPNDSESNNTNKNLNNVNNTKILNNNTSDSDPAPKDNDSNQNLLTLTSPYILQKSLGLTSLLLPSSYNSPSNSPEWRPLLDYLAPKHNRTRSVILDIESNKILDDEDVVCAPDGLICSWKKVVELCREQNIMSKQIDKLTSDNTSTDINRDLYVQLPGVQGEHQLKSFRKVYLC